MDGVSEVNDVEPDPNHPLAGNICAIDKKSVHRICSGQVVLTLATAVKELLENSIDAGATIVDIKLKDYGSESIEVSDNGGGVQEKNFQGLTLKHHTSKLEDFSDLVNVETFGFRGEALSSLCALSNMSVTTRHESSAVGTKLEFDHNGKITHQQSQARQVGTSVVLQNLFYTLPVRHKEFQRNVKKEFVKMVQVLNSYCIISINVRITCTNQTGKGNRSTVVSSKGNVGMLDNISNVFGPKQAQNLLVFKKIEPTEEHCTEFGIKNHNSSRFNIEGYVSKCDHGLGRSSTDRQFFFINGRPFDSNKLNKVVNEVYHQYNRHQYPFVVFTISVQKDNVDVNVTPDKRQVFLEGEKVIMATVKASLIAMYEPTTSVLHYQNPISINSGKGKSLGGSSDITKLSRHSSLEKPTGLSSLMKLKRSFSSAFAKEQVSDKSSPSNSGSQVKQRRLDSFISKYSSPTKYKSKTHSDLDPSDNHADNVILLDQVTDDITEVCDTDGNNVDNKLEKFTSKTAISYHGNSSSFHSNSSVCEQDVNETGDHTLVSENTKIPQDEVNFEHTVDNQETESVKKRGNYVHISTQNDHNSDGAWSQQDEECVHDSETTLENNLACVRKNLNIDDRQCVPKRLSVLNVFKSGDPGVVVNESISDEYVCDDNNDVTDSRTDTWTYAIQQHKTKEQSIDNIAHSVDVESAENDEHSISFKSDNNAVECKADVVDGDCEVVDEDLDCEETVIRKEKIVRFSMESLKHKWKSRKNKNEDGRFSRAFRATINPAENSAAEQELQKEIKKEMFSEMEILGQFNQGFIITKLQDDLFIVDQHATDEKYNFETLQRDYVIQSQKLICPMNLELTSSNETILMDNIDIFKKNGFEFVINEEGAPTQRVKLASTPVSKNWNFGKEDIEEMIFMLTDSPGVTCRPSRVRAMFASRACRKSIMIGTTLKPAEMKKLVCHMGEIEQPWNCPHGRPTMRHLINLDMIPK